MILLQILESSFSLLQHEFSQQNDKNKKIEDKFKDNKRNTEILISNIQDNVSYYFLILSVYVLFYAKIKSAQFYNRSLSISILFNKKVLQ